MKVRQPQNSTVYLSRLQLAEILLVNAYRKRLNVMAARFQRLLGGIRGIISAAKPLSVASRLQFGECGGGIVVCYGNSAISLFFAIATSSAGVYCPSE